MANTFMTHRQMGEAEAYYKILPNMTLKFSSLDTIFIPSDKKELRSRFLMKLQTSDDNSEIGVEVKGGRDGLFLEKPDIIDKYCRREITDDNLELEELSPTQFGKMFQPVSRKKTDQSKEDDEKKQMEDNEEGNNVEDDAHGEIIVGEREENEDKIVTYYITTNPIHSEKRLPKFIKIKDPVPGEVTLWERRSFPKAARMHKKQEDNNPHRFFLSELMLYTGWTNEQDLGCDDEVKCTKLYLKKYDSIQYVKKNTMPFAQGVEEARHYVQQAMNDERSTKVMLVMI